MPLASLLCSPLSLCRDSRCLALERRGAFKIHGQLSHEMGFEAKSITLARARTLSDAVHEQTLPFILAPLGQIVLGGEVKGILVLDSTLSSAEGLIG